MNIDNLNKLIAHLEAQPPERFNMRFVFTGPSIGVSFVVPSFHDCGTAACIAGHCALVAGRPVGVSFDGTEGEEWLGITPDAGSDLFCPQGYASDAHRYPLYRAIATLKRLRDTYLATGQVVVDWGPEPGDEPKTPWVAPQVAEVIAPALPAEITSLLRPSPVKTEA